MTVVFVHFRHVQTNIETTSYTQEETRSQRKLFFKKRSTSSTCAVSCKNLLLFFVKKITINPEQSLLEAEGIEDQYRVSQSPLSNLRRKGATIRPTLTPRHSERALLSDSTSSSERNSVGRLSGIVRWFKGSSKERCSIDLESGVIGPDLAASFIRHGSLKIQGRRAGEGLGRSLQRARRRVERRLGRIGIGKGKKKVTGTEEVAGSCMSLIFSTKVIKQ